jgi:hypothetical protein
MNTKELVESSPIFKIIKKGLMVKYPWIKNVYVDSDEDIQKYHSMIFLNMDIDLPQLLQSVDATPSSWVHTEIMRKVWGRDHYDTVYLSTFVRDEDRDKMKEVQDDVEADVKRMQKSLAIPEEFRYKDKSFGVSSFRWVFPPPEQQPSPIVTN